jgi:hypothetical protein
MYLTVRLVYYYTNVFENIVKYIRVVHNVLFACSILCTIYCLRVAYCVQHCLRVVQHNKVLQ